MTRIFPYLVSLAVVGLASFFGWITQAFLDPTEMIMFYLLGVVVIALNWGYGPAVFTSAAGVLALDFYFVPPRFGFVPHRRDFFVLAVFSIVGLVTSILAARARTGAIRAKESEARQAELFHEKEKLQMILLYSLSHDLRTPLFSIEGTLRNLLKSGQLDDATRQELIEAAYQESGRLSRMIGNLLDMTKVEAGSLEMTLRPCGVQDLIGTSLQQFSKEQIGERPIKINALRYLPEIMIDLALMVRVFVNLLDNAFKYSPKDSAVEITAWKKGEFLSLEILNEGGGIPEKDLKRVFEKFYRVEPAKKVGGIGLGLSICKGLVEQHKGKIHAENWERGTKIVVSLPLAG